MSLVNNPESYHVLQEDTEEYHHSILSTINASLFTRLKVSQLKDFSVHPLQPEKSVPFDCRIYSHHMPSGETVKRQWLSYSDAKEALFCPLCVAFEPVGSVGTASNFVTGFKDFRRVSQHVADHEASKPIANMFKITFDR